MKGLAVLRRTTETHGWQQAVVPIVVGLSLVAWTLGTGPAVAETPRSARIVQNPATTVRTLSAGQSDEPVSEEIWIRSDVGPSATAERAEPKGAETEPVPKTQVSFRVSRPSDSPRVSPLAARILRFRPPSPSPSTPDESEKPPTAQNSPEEGLADEVKASSPSPPPRPWPLRHRSLLRAGFPKPSRH